MITDITVKDGFVLVRREIDGKVYRDGALPPGADLTGKEPEIVSAANAAWTPEVVAAYQATIPAPIPTPIPTVVTMRQARLALLQVNLLTTVSAAIAAGNDADKITWEYAAEVRRDDDLVTNMAATLNLDAAALDGLFTLADTL